MSGITSELEGVIRIYRNTNLSISQGWEARLTLDRYEGSYRKTYSVLLKLVSYGKSEEDAVEGLREAITEVNATMTGIDFSKRVYVTNDDKPIDDRRWRNGF